MCAIRNSSSRMPLTAMTTFLKTQLVFTTSGFPAAPESVTVATRSTLGPGEVCGQVNTG